MKNVEVPKNLIQQLKNHMWKICNPTVCDEGNELLYIKQMILEISYHTFTSGLLYHELTSKDGETKSLEEETKEGVRKLFKEYDMISNASRMFHDIISCKTAQERESVLQDYLDMIKNAVKNALERLEGSPIKNINLKGIGELEGKINVTGMTMNDLDNTMTITVELDENYDVLKKK